MFPKTKGLVFLKEKAVVGLFRAFDIDAIHTSGYCQSQEAFPSFSNFYDRTQGLKRRLLTCLTFAIVTE